MDAHELNSLFESCKDLPSAPKVTSMRRVANAMARLQGEEASNDVSDDDLIAAYRALRPAYGKRTVIHNSSHRLEGVLRPDFGACRLIMRGGYAVTSKTYSPEDLEFIGDTDGYFEFRAKEENPGTNYLTGIDAVIEKFYLWRAGIREE